MRQNTTNIEPDILSKATIKVQQALYFLDFFSEEVLDLIYETYAMIYIEYTQLSVIILSKTINKTKTFSKFSGFIT